MTLMLVRPPARDQKALTHCRRFGVKCCSRVPRFGWGHSDMQPADWGRNRVGEYPSGGATTIYLEGGVPDMTG